jgi:hypothetical protein
LRPEVILAPFLAAFITLTAPGITPWVLHGIPPATTILKGPFDVGFGGLARKIFGSSNDRRVKGMRPRVEAINAMENEPQLSDQQLRARTEYSSSRTSPMAPR